MGVPVGRKAGTTVNAYAEVLTEALPKGRLEGAIIQPGDIRGRTSNQKKGGQRRPEEEP
jgi:hypothetical protein